MDYNYIVKIGTRGSRLALVQTDLVIDAIHKHDPQLQCETIVINTLGDKILDKPLIEFGGKGVFISEFEEALMSREIDLAVHSAKDMPMELCEGLEIACVLKREDPRDVLITMKPVKIQELESAIIGTSSLRRQLQIEQLYGNIKCTLLRGNVNTRLKKLADGIYDGIILAAAGIKRLGLDNEPEYNYRYFDFDEMIPAGGQGIVAVEARVDSELGQMLQNISDQVSGMELEIERKVLHLFEAGCHEPIGVFSEVKQGEIKLRIMKEVNGKILKQTGKVDIENRLELVERLVKNVLEEI
ncbi:hydroxymethylbilane synthase [[Clostridium] fimetarium]|uniref:Porphobilinogen deaminase n=1 Tax=[Clostridium] fimetarium TaxID=99656 RepID=A0A1I0PXU3_9FIRM|nr:hydroxymethylbilane synthase [[Clostridium] fimetarium]SEW19008.1 hydroxymethylbilane synthase [[Clostridium] fimetarium]